VILELDIGNSRVKWRTLEGGAPVARGHCRRDAGDWPARLPQAAVERLRVANVGGAGAAAELTAWARECLGLTPEYARSTATRGGVTNAYAEPGRLGVDRWLALLAAWRELGRACVVVSAGTALTLDVLDGDGRHRGGYIVPGLGLMLEVLQSRTSGVRFAPGPAASLEPGRSTAAAVLQGCTAMIAALIERSRAEPEQPVLLTGGDAERLAPWIAAPLHLRPELVLDGLGIALP
jgi:type III pantothenate kinase